MELSRRLSQIEIPGADEIKKRWSEFAGSKPDDNEVKPVIVSPIESGSIKERSYRQAAEKMGPAADFRR